VWTELVVKCSVCGRKVEALYAEIARVKSGVTDFRHPRSGADFVAVVLEFPDHPGKIESFPRSPRAHDGQSIFQSAQRRMLHLSLHEIRKHKLIEPL